MTTYRPSRNLEATLIEKIETILSDNDWDNVSVEKSFARVYEIPMNQDTKNAIICVSLENTIHSSVEVGSDITKRKPLLLVDVFAHDDGQRLDLKDFLISELKHGWSYVEFVITDGKVGSRTTNGRIEVLSISDTPINFGIPKEQLDAHDRHRHRISLSCEKSALEA